MNYDTYRKRGRHWEYLGERYAQTMHGAACAASYVHHIKMAAVRPAGSRDKLYVYKFEQPAEVHHGR
jgi:hypothetical protein